MKVSIIGTLIAGIVATSLFNQVRTNFELSQLFEFHNVVFMEQAIRGTDNL